MTDEVLIEEHRRRPGLAAALSLLLLVGGACTDEEGPQVAKPGSGQWESVRAGGLDARLFVPTGAPPQGRGLMVVLHGCAQRASDLGDGGNWEAAAEGAGWVVAAPAVPGGGVLFGCWDYYGEDHERTSGHPRFVLDLVNDLGGQPELDIDAGRIYVSGLSSGAGMALVLACLAPDVFAGVGLAAGPAVGTGAAGADRISTTVSDAVRVCRQLAKNESRGFETQLAAIVHGADDRVVAPAYGRLNAETFAELYRAGGPSSASTLGLPGARPEGRRWLWSDERGPRVDLIEHEGLGHNWASGAGSARAFVNGSSLGFPEHLSRFFEAERRRGAGGRGR